LPPAALALPQLTLGFSSGSQIQLADSSPGTEAFWTARAQEAGAQMIRLNAFWSSIAPVHRPAGFNASDPASPGYNWTGFDQAVRNMTGAGFRVLISVVDAPKWAEGPHMPRSATPGTWEPNATDLGEFATAIARRYSGGFPDPAAHHTRLPRVRWWQAWNEPNLTVDLAPQYLRTATGGFRPESPIIYRRLANAFYASVKAVSASNYVVQAGVAPYGDYPAGGQRMPPVIFEQTLLCLTPGRQPVSCPTPVHFDAIDSHPYGIYGPTWHAIDPGDVSVPDVYKLTRLLRAAERFHTVLPAGPKGNWVTEFSWDTKPPDPQAVPINTEAHWLEQALYVLWRQGVNTILWFQLVDSPPIPNYSSTYQAGVFFLDGHAKPGLTAFEFPFVTNRLNPSTVEAWGRAPASGTLDVQELVGGHWQTIKSVFARRGRIFEAQVPIAGKAVLKATLDGQSSLSWNQSA
jgi:hypothetical protein